MVDIRQTSEYAKYLSKIGWTIKRKGGINYFIKKLPLIGSVLKIQRPERIDYQFIDKLVAKHKVFQIILEPSLASGFGTFQGNQLRVHRFKLSKSPYLPSRTIQLDLVLSEKDLPNQLHKDCKTALKKTANYELQTVNYVVDFRNAWKRVVGFKRYVPPLSHLEALKKSFGNKAFFLLADDNAGAIFLIGDKTAYYWQAFTNKEGRKKQIQYQIVWQGILWAKKMGAKLFDFEGIYDERFPNKSWLGFTHFKKSFGGKGVEYLGCYTKLCFPKLNIK